MIQAENLEHVKLIAHVCDTLRHHIWQLIIAEIECVQAFQLADGLDQVFRHAVVDFQLFHLEVLYVAVLVAEEILQNLELLSFNQHSVYT